MEILERVQHALAMHKAWGGEYVENASRDRQPMLVLCVLLKESLRGVVSWLLACSWPMFFFILETDADQNWPNGHENAPRGSKNEIKIAHGAPKMQLGTPNGAQRRPKETSEEAKGDFGRAKVDPRAPRCAPREARMPPESAKMVPL